MIQDAVNEKYDAIVLPGGMPGFMLKCTTWVFTYFTGARHLSECEPLISALRQQKEEGRLVAAICASPVVVLQSRGLLSDTTAATAHPAFSDKLANQAAVEQRVVIDGNCITSRAPGTALEFSLAIVKELFDEKKAKQVAKPMLVANF